MPVLIFSLFLVFLGGLLSSHGLAQDMPVVVNAQEEQSVIVPEATELTIESNLDQEADLAVEKMAPKPIDSELGEDSFFDAEDLVPRGEMAGEGPVKVNPVTQPGSRFIIVRENHEAQSVSAKLVSAERALALGRYDSASMLFDGLYKENKKDPRVLMGRAITFQKLGRFEEAMSTYEALSKLEPHNVDIKINMLGLLSTKYPSVALRRLLELHSENSGHTGLAAQIAIVSAKVGDTEGALRYLGMAASIEPKNANHIYNMAIISDRAGNRKEAIAFYEEALEIDTIHGAGRSIPRDRVYERLSEIR